MHRTDTPVSSRVYTSDSLGALQQRCCPCCPCSPCSPLSNGLSPFRDATALSAVVADRCAMKRESWAPDATRPEVWRRYFNTPAEHVVYADDRVVVVRDRSPRAVTHLLVLPRFEEVTGAESLRPSHASLLAHMGDVGARAAAAEAGAAAGRGPLVLGFHRRPLRSVEHLHLHVLQPPFVPRWQRLRYWEPPRCLPLAFVNLASVMEKLDAARDDLV